MLKSTLCYEQNSKTPHLLDGFYKGICYKNAKKRSWEENEGNDEEDRCVIMDCMDDEYPMKQIMLSRRMKYALKVLDINNTKVIYPFFDKTMSQWLDDARLPKDMWCGKWMKTEVMPKIREIWKLLHEMKERNIQISNKRNNDPTSTGHYMPLIRKKSKLLKLRGGRFVPEEVMLLPRLLKLQEGDDHDKNYANYVFDEVRRAHDLPKKFELASTLWNTEIEKDEITSLNYWLCSKHPIFYDPADKERFLLLINSIIFRYGLKDWLNGAEETFKWVNFLDYINRAKRENRKAYQQTLQHKAGQSRGSASKKGKLEEPLSYSAGSDIVRFTRNTLMHFEQNYKKGNNNAWHRGLDVHEREIVEILDDELNVCSIHYDIARTIIANDPPDKYTEEGWKKYQANKWKILKERKQAQAAEVIGLAYQPAQLKVWNVSVWMKAEEIFGHRERQFLVDMDMDTNLMKASDILKHQPRLYTKEGWKLSWMELEDIKNKIKQPLEFRTEDSGRRGWNKLENIKKKANQQLKLLTEGWRWKQVKEIIEANQPPSLYVKKGEDEYWMKAFETNQEAAEFLTMENWLKAREELENFFNSLK